MKIHLTFAAVNADGLSAWAFALRASDRIVKNRYLHAGSGTDTWHRVSAGFMALGSALRWLTDNGHAGATIVLHSSQPEVMLAITTPATPLTNKGRRLRDRCLELLAGFKWTAKPIGEDDNKSDEIARLAWESATFNKFPNRPTRRRMLPAFTKRKDR